MTSVSGEVPAALAQAYAYGTDDLLIETLEFRHPLLVSDFGDNGQIRVAQFFQRPADLEEQPFWEGRLDAGAPLNPGEVVRFVRMGFKFSRPERSTSGAPQFQLEIDNVDARIGDALRAAADTEDPIFLTVRTFTESTRLSGEPDVLDGFELREPEVTASIVRARGQGPDVLNRGFHKERYDARFPLLGL
jgi:hypothetical protein